MNSAKHAGFKKRKKKKKPQTQMSRTWTWIQTHLKYNLETILLGFLDSMAWKEKKEEEKKGG